MSVTLVFLQPLQFLSHAHPMASRPTNAASMDEVNCQHPAQAVTKDFLFVPPHLTMKDKDLGVC